MRKGSDYKTKDLGLAGTLSKRLSRHLREKIVVECFYLYELLIESTYSLLSSNFS